MKNFLFLIITFLTFHVGTGQEVKNISDNLIYDVKGLDLKPDFHGGRDEFYKFIAKNYRTPDVKKLNGKNYVTFVIEKMAL